MKRSVIAMNSADCTEVMVDAGTGVRLRTLKWGIPTQSAQVPLVLIHGLASNALLWQGAAHEFMTMGHAVVAIDLRGHGLSEKPDDGYDMQSVTNDVVGVLRALADQGYDRPVVVGQSWGGNIVVELAHTHPELVRGVVAVDGGFLELQTHFPQWEECSIALRPQICWELRLLECVGTCRALTPTGRNQELMDQWPTLSIWQMELFGRGSRSIAIS